MQAIQAIHATESAAETDLYQLPVEPTEESQADTGIDHPLVSCSDCGAIWRSHGRSKCPMGGCGEGYRLSLTARQNSNLYVAMSNLEHKECYTEAQMELQMWRFRNVLREDAPWYDMNSRQMIQACYQNVSERAGTHPNAAVAIAFFKEEFEFAPEEDNTVFPEVIHYQPRDAQYDLQHPSW
jgi:hypothetical protein